MRTVTYNKNIYSFDELTDETKEKAIDNLRDINVDHDWWESCYENSRLIGMNITAFDISRPSYIHATFNYDAPDIAKKIIETHGSQCETYTLASTYLKSIEKLTSQHNEDEATYDLLAELEENFLHSLREEYLSMLRKEYEYLTSDEVVIESIQANGYEFDENGNLA